MKYDWLLSVASGFIFLFFKQPKQLPISSSLNSIAMTRPCPSIPGQTLQLIGSNFNNVIYFPSSLFWDKFSFGDPIRSFWPRHQSCTPLIDTHTSIWLRSKTHACLTDSVLQNFWEVWSRLMFFPVSCWSCLQSPPFSLVYPTSCTCSVLTLFHFRTHYNTKHCISSSTASIALVVLWPLLLSMYTVLAECEASALDFVSADTWDIEFKCFLASVSDQVSLGFTVYWLNAWTYLCVESSDAIYCLLYLIYIFYSLPTNATASPEVPIIRPAGPNYPAGRD